MLGWNRRLRLLGWCMVGLLGCGACWIEVQGQSVAGMNRIPVTPALWMQGSYNWRLAPGWRVIVEPELRLERGLGWERFQSDFWGDYRWKKKGKGPGWEAGLAGGWRLALRNNGGQSPLRPRWMMDARLGQRWGSWSLDYRLRWQQQFSDFGGSVPERGQSYGRHKVSLGFKLPTRGSLEWSEEFWVPVPGEMPGLKAWNPGVYDHRRSTLQFRWKNGNSTWSVGAGLDRDRFYPGQSEPLAILRLGHQGSFPARFLGRAAVLPRSSP